MNLIETTLSGGRVANPAAEGSFQVGGFSRLSPSSERQCLPKGRDSRLFGHRYLSAFTWPLVNPGGSVSPNLASALYPRYGFEPIVGRNPRCRTFRFEPIIASARDSLSPFTLGSNAATSNVTRASAAAILQIIKPGSSDSSVCSRIMESRLSISLAHRHLAGTSHKRAATRQLGPKNKHPRHGEALKFRGLRTAR